MVLSLRPLTVLGSLLTCTLLAPTRGLAVTAHRTPTDLESRWRPHRSHRRWDVLPKGAKRPRFECMWMGKQRVSTLPLNVAQHFILDSSTALASVTQGRASQPILT